MHRVENSRNILFCLGNQQLSYKKKKKTASIHNSRILVHGHPIEIYHQVQMHCKVSLTQFSQFAWNIWMKSNKEKFSNPI